MSNPEYIASVDPCQAEETDGPFVVNIFKMSFPELGEFIVEFNPRLDNPILDNDLYERGE